MGLHMGNFSEYAGIAVILQTTTHKPKKDWLTTNTEVTLLTFSMRPTKKQPSLIGNHYYKKQTQKRTKQ